MAHRYFLDEIVENTAFVRGEEAKHLFKVMRIRAGDKIILCDKNGYDYTAVADNIEEAVITFQILDKKKNVANPNASLTVYMALSKSDKLELIIQKMCELGAIRFVPFVSEYCIAQKSKNDNSKKQRFQKISQEAAKQCGRSIPMEICDTITYKQLLSDIKTQATSMMFYENATIPLHDVSISKEAPVGIIIGSEGGFSEKEVAQSKEQGVHIITLGNRILRCETAAITATSLVMYKLGELE